VGETLPANISETLALPEFSVEGGEGIDDGNDGCYAIIHLGGGSDGVCRTRGRRVYLLADGQGVESGSGGMEQGVIEAGGWNEEIA